MPTLACVTTCKSRLDHLKQTLPRMMSFEDTEVVVVDYDCPQGTGAWVRGAFPAAKVVSVTNEPGFNAARARNLGAQASGAPWLLFLDADTVASADLPEQVKRRVSEELFLLPDPRPAELWGALVVARESFDLIEGYDEAVQGWGSEDVDITERLEQLGLRAGSFPGALIEALPHSDESRVLHHDVKDLLLIDNINYLYREAKRDLTKLGLTLDLASRHNLYAAARQVALDEGPRTLEVPFKTWTGAGMRRSVQASLKYQLKPVDK